MVNRHRGEVPLEIAGQRLSLRLTLGGLAEIEDALQAGDLVGLSERLGSGRLSAKDLICILHIGLKGAGHDIAAAEIKAWSVQGGLDLLISAVAALFQEAFGSADEAYPRPPKP